MTTSGPPGATEAPRDWRPSASHEALRLRAALLARARQFFAERAVLEVETPLMVRHAVSDANLGSWRVQHPSRQTPAAWLATSPEYAMKRLLAAGSGDIYQLGRVFRVDESGRLHQPEFTMLEWYRVGFDLAAIVEETGELINALLCRAGRAPRAVKRRRWAEVLRAATGLDPLACGTQELAERARQEGLRGADGLDRDALLDFLMGVSVGPTLGLEAIEVITHYPASQAALARLDPEDARVALRFEAYLDGMELANGYVELTDAREQRERFERDAAQRRARGLPAVQIDSALLAALEHGLPPCAGVALGFDRLVMCAAGARRIDEVISFRSEDA